MDVILEVGKYYRFRDALFLAKVCEVCPRNIHKVREGCDIKHGKVMTSLHLVGHLNQMPHPQLNRTLVNGAIVECSFRDRGIYWWDSLKDEVRQALSKEVAQVILEKI